MAKNVIILGAGASKESGGPLMEEFMDVAKNLLDRGEIKETEDFQRVIDAQNKLMRIYTKARINLYNLEGFFAALEMSDFLGMLADYDDEERKKILKSMKILIGKTLEASIKLPVIPNSNSPRPSPTYESLIKVINDYEFRTNTNSISIISFNYDLALDYGLHFYSIPIDYGFDLNNNSKKIGYYKLHGSLNWGCCSKCGEIIPLYLSEYFKKRSWNFWHEPKYALLTIFDHVKEMSHCETQVEDTPFFIPPTWNKSNYHKQLSNVWKNAASRINEAENIFIIGYSLPATDFFFRDFYAISTIGDNQIRKFWVIDPDTTNEVENRYVSLIGDGVAPRFKFERMKFSESIHLISQNL
jgi:hypothetical protein